MIMKNIVSVLELLRGQIASKRFRAKNLAEGRDSLGEVIASNLVLAHQLAVEADALRAFKVHLEFLIDMKDQEVLV